MKPFIFFVAICILCSCSRRHSSHNNDTPIALETNKSSSVFKRVPSDLVENIYDQLVSETPELKELENQIENANDRKNDSLSEYQKFTDKNEQYYTSAE
ncbi:MAG TPA: hypothetical protein VGQ53_24100, partial [Chitinophagaceae bacterium]|nr:hypothetical protein [Chitinophagaceae bacterium]